MGAEPKPRGRAPSEEAPPSPTMEGLPWLMRGSDRSRPLTTALLAAGLGTWAAHLGGNSLRAQLLTALFAAIGGALVGLLMGRLRRRVLSAPGTDGVTRLRIKQLVNGSPAHNEAERAVVARVVKRWQRPGNRRAQRVAFVATYVFFAVIGAVSIIDALHDHDEGGLWQLLVSLAILFPLLTFALRHALRTQRRVEEGVADHHPSDENEPPKTAS